MNYYNIKWKAESNEFCFYNSPLPKIKSLIRRCNINNVTTTFYFIVFKSAFFVQTELDCFMFFPQNSVNINPYAKHPLSYKECGISKNCMGSPIGCVKNMNCHAVIAVQPCVENKCLIEMLAFNSEYVAFGLSNDMKMVRF